MYFFKVIYRYSKIRNKYEKVKRFKFRVLVYLEEGERFNF